MTVEFETERLVVRDWEHEDVERAFDLYSRWEVSRWLGAQPKVMESRDAAVRMVDRWAELNAAERIGGRWAVARKDDGVVAGTVLLIPLPDGQGEYEVGWHFHPDSWGNGYATESARATLDRGFARGLREAFAVVHPGNDASVAVCRRLGMQPMGRTDRYYQSVLELFRIGVDDD